MKIQENIRKSYVEINACRLCGSKNLHDILDLGSQPPANSLRKNLDEAVPTAPLKLVQCAQCSAVQLTVTVDPEYLFSQYVWVTATSSTARDYSEKFCNKVLSQVLSRSPFIVEIASNDGTFLRRFKEKGCEVLGIDPAKNIADAAIDSGIPTLAQFFDVNVAKKILAEHEQVDVVIARNVIPHVKEIYSIVEGLSTLVGSGGKVVVEFHYAKAIIEELHYDSIYHEHLFYFSLKSIGSLFEQYGLHAFDVFESPISGGSLVLFFSSEQKRHSEALKKLLETEERSGLNQASTWRQFGENSKKHAKELKKMVGKYAQKSPLVAYGASARSSTLMNYAGITNREIEYVIDRSAYKHGLYTPGTDIPIVSYEEGVRKLDGKNVLLLAWNFEEEVVRDLRSSGFKGDIIVPLPNEIHIR